MLVPTAATVAVFFSAIFIRFAGDNAAIMVWLRMALATGRLARVVNRQRLARVDRLRRRVRALVSASGVMLAAISCCGRHRPTSRRRARHWRPRCASPWSVNRWQRGLQLVVAIRRCRRRVGGSSRRASLTTLLALAILGRAPSAAASGGGALILLGIGNSSWSREHPFARALRSRWSEAQRALSL